MPAHRQRRPAAPAGDAAALKAKAVGFFRAKDFVEAVAAYGRVCAGFSKFEDNVAVGSWIGYRIQDGGCNSLDLRAHRNSVGLIVDSDEVSNFVGAENGIGLAPIATPWVCSGKEWKVVESSGK